MPKTADETGAKTVDIATLPYPQLTQLKKQLDDELAHLTNSFQSLRVAQSKFRDCLKSISTAGFSPSTTPSSQPSPSAAPSILVPLTTSLYVPGTLAPTAPLLVDVGTGFFVEKDGAGATDFYNRKVEELGANLKDLEAVINAKGRTVRIVEDVIRQKVLSGAATGTAQGAPTAAAAAAS